MKLAAVLARSLALLGLLPLLAACPKTDTAPVRVVLVTLDTLRYDRFAGSDGQPTQMPLTRRWAEQAALFQKFYAVTSSTQPSHATMFTALQPWQHGVSRNGQVLADEIVTVAERLKQAGFATAAVVGSVPLHRQFGFGQGFDDYKEPVTHGVGRGAWEGVDIANEHFYALADTITDDAIALIDHARSPRQFFWFHYFDPHEPYGDSGAGEDEIVQTPALLERAARGLSLEEDLRRARRMYDLDVSYLDRALARLLQRLEQDSGTIQTHVVVVADHGESLGEDGALGHGKRLDERQLHVPMVIRSARVQAGARLDVAGSIDVTPTILSLAGVRELPPAGRDLLPPADGEPHRVFGMRRTYVKPFVEVCVDGTQHVLDGRLFYETDGEAIYTGNGLGLSGPEAGLQAMDAAARQQMLALFRSFELELDEVAVEEKVDRDTRRALRALGYVQ